MLSILDIGIGITLLCDVISLVISVIGFFTCKDTEGIARIIAALGFFIFMWAASLEYMFLPFW